MTDELPGALQAAINVEKQVWPHTIDAQVWAKQFMDHLPQFEKPIDEEIMCVWFANAIMAGYDTAQSRAAKPRPWLRAEEVTEPGWYWHAPGDLTMHARRAIEPNGGKGLIVLIGHFYTPIGKCRHAEGCTCALGGLWQRIPEPELPEEEI